MNIDIWSDVVCPWCYVGKRRFESALDRFDHAADVTVTWHSFELDPAAANRSEAGGAAVDYADALAAKFGTGRARAVEMLDSMAATAALDGLDYHFDIAKQANTFDAHRLLHLAADRGLQGALKERLMAAMFTEGRPVDDRDTLADLAAEVGLDRSEAARVLADGTYGERVRADEEQARAYGISGVPFFVLDGRYGISGAQPADTLLQALEQAWQERNPLTVLAGSPDAASCEGDSCAV